MAASKHKLQRDVFLPSQERLVAVVSVTKPGKKKSRSFLCVAETAEKPSQTLLYQVKKSDKGDSYKKKRQWALRELKILDAGPSNNRLAEFETFFDKSYKWNADNTSEKNEFILSVWKASRRNLVQKPEFKNVPPGLFKESSHKEDEDKNKTEEDTSITADWEYNALTSKEESDLESLMSESESAINNLETFAEQLAKDLSVLDGANVHSIMMSEDAVVELMQLLDRGLMEAITIEEKLDEYEQKLQGIKDLMENMKDKDTLIQVRTQNHNKLLNCLDTMVENLNLEPQHMRALRDGNLSTARGIQDCVSAANALLKCMNADIHPSMVQMSAVNEQQKKFDKLKNEFSKRLCHHLNNFFIHQGNAFVENRVTSDLKLPKHTSVHKELLPYAELMFWLKQTDAKAFNQLVKVYTKNISLLYEKEIKDFLEQAKQKFIAGRKEGTVWLMAGDKHSLRGSSNSLNKDSHSTGSTSTLNSLRGSDPDLGNRTKFDQLFEHVLSELEPVCLAEQDFCVKFFSLADEEPQESDKAESTPTKADADSEQKMMSELFRSLDSEFNNFVQFGDKVDNFNCLYMLVRMSQHVMSAEDTGSFLTKTLGMCLICIKKHFDRFIDQKCHAVRDYKPNKKSKVGIIPFVHLFEEFAQQAESIFKSSSRRMELDKAYIELLSTIFSEIIRVAQESQKSPREVVLFENFHHVYAVLSQLKIASLDNQRKESKQRYQQFLNEYVTVMLGRPMEKLNVFFEGVEAKVASGVKAEEVGFQLAYSKQELRKNIKEYPGKEVKKGLDHLYKKVEKHVCEEENLLQVVWHNMQDEFLKQYKHFDGLISRCYPGSGITLEFSIQDVLGYFSDIAHSH